MNLHRKGVTPLWQHLADGPFDKNTLGCVMPTGNATPTAAVEVFTRKSQRVDFSECDVVPGSPIWVRQNRSSSSRNRELAL